jgi:hypothetical protein
MVGFTDTPVDDRALVGAGAGDGGLVEVSFRSRTFLVSHGCSP